MPLDDIVLDMISEKIKEDVRTPSGATNFTLILQKECLKNGYEESPPSLNTVKRLVGLHPYVGTRPQTMNLIAKFLDYEDWQDLAEDCKIRLASAFVRRKIFMDMRSFGQGVEVELAWKPDRRLELRHDGDGQYTVIKSENCKLLPGDRLSLGSLSIGYPFVADKVFRGDTPLGAYRAAEGTELHRLIIKNEKN